MALPRIYLMAVYSFLVVLLMALTYVSGDDVIVQRKPDAERLDQEELQRLLEQDDRPRKRPFCNAFAGCGRKRSVDSVARLFDLNSEPAVEELNKRILSEAKRLEAIREARAAFARQRSDLERMISRSLEKRSAGAFAELSEQRAQR